MMGDYQRAACPTRWCAAILGGLSQRQRQRVGVERVVFQSAGSYWSRPASTLSTELSPGRPVMGHLLGDIARRRTRRDNIQHGRIAG